MPAGALGPGGSLAAGQRRGIRRAAAASAGGAARALGFAGLDHNVATVQNGRGKLEADALFWCVQLGHDLRLASAT